MSVRRICSALVGPVLVAGALAVTGAPAVARTGAAAMPPVTRAALTSVLLPTGDRVGFGTGPAGRPATEVVPAHRAITAYSTMRLGSDTYVLPSIARPYLQRFLDPALFDVTALARAGDPARLPVRLTYTGTAKPSVPGITIGSAAGGTATGYLTAASAATFGLALQRQYLADATAGWPARTALFGTVTRIAAVSAAPPGASPHFVQKTLIVDVLDASGKPLSFGLMNVVNVDDARKYIGFAEVVDGEARISVPVGHYAGVVEVDDFSATGDSGAIRIVPFDNASVTTNDQRLTLDARKATSTLSVHTPRPAGLVTESWEWDRTAAGDTGGAAAGYLVGPGVTLSVASTAVPPASVGSLHSVASWSLAGAPTSGAAYTYDLAFASSGVPAQQSHLVSASQLAVQHARYYTDGEVRRGDFLRSVLFPFQIITGGLLNPVSLPQARTEYVASSPGAVWTSILLPDDTLADPFGDEMIDTVRPLPPGSVSPAYWGAGPLVPGAPHFSAAATVSCLTCRNAGAMRVIYALVTDTTPGHQGGVTTSDDGTPVARLRVWADATKILDETDSTGDEFPVRAASATYRVVYDVNRRLSGAQQSVATHTDISFASAAGSGGRLPTGWVCDLGSSCTIPAVLQASVSLPVDLTGSAPTGKSVIGLSIEHIQGAPAYPITSASMQIRVGGGSWQTLPRTSTGPGTYRFALDVTRAQSGKPVDLRVYATDNHGGRFEQSTTTAFVVSSS